MPYEPLHTGKMDEFTLFFEVVNRQFPGHRKPFWGSELSAPAALSDRRPIDAAEALRGPCLHGIFRVSCASPSECSGREEFQKIFSASQLVSSLQSSPR
jgi:hypothetical protein